MHSSLQRKRAVSAMAQGLSPFYQCTHWCRYSCRSVFFSPLQPFIQSAYGFCKCLCVMLPAHDKKRESALRSKAYSVQQLGSSKLTLWFLNI